MEWKPQSANPNRWLTAKINGKRICVDPASTLIYIGEYGKAADLLQAGAADGDSAHLSDVELLRHTVGDAPFQYLQVRLLNGHPIRCETCAFDVEFTVRSAILDEAVKERIPVYFTHVTDIPVPLMFREVVQSSNKLPALRFLFFLLIHGVTRLASPAFSLVEGGGY